ncbi:MAG: DUF3078 domain-containing protein [Balneolales bacterium]
MQRATLLTLLIIVFIPAISDAHIFGQATSDTAKVIIKKPNWKFSLQSGLNGTQAAYRKWNQGGVNNITAIGYTQGTGDFSRGVYRYSGKLNMRYGQSRLEDNEVRKSEDIIRFRNQFTRKFEDKRFGMVTHINFETQFDKGFNKNRDEIVSRFFAPAYLTETIGFSYSPEDTDFEMDTGLALKQTYIRDTNLSTRYGLDEGQRFQNEAGFSMIFKYEKQLMENVTYNGYLETFSNVLKKLDSTDFTFNNEFTGRINQYLRANLELAFQYNDSVTRALQIKQMLSIGFNYKIL